MRRLILALLVLCTACAPLTVRAATCKHPRSPSPEQDAPTFLALFIAGSDIENVFPLCGHPKLAKVGIRTYTFDKNGRPLSTGLGSGKTLFMYDEAGNLVETRALDGNGNITSREMLKWSGSYEVTKIKLRKDGTADVEPVKLTLDLAARTVTIRDGSTIVAHQFDEHWNTIGLVDETIRFETERDGNGYRQKEWMTTAKHGRQPMLRYSYSGSDAKGNPTTIAVEYASMQYGVMKWGQPSKEKRVILYW